jgi:hypothetical protein
MSERHWRNRLDERPESWKPLGHSEEQKKKWSAERKGKCYNRTIPLSEARTIIEQFDDSVVPPIDLATIVKASQRDIVTSLPFEQLRSPNGRPLSLKVIYSHYYAAKYNVTPVAIRQLLDGKLAMADLVNEQ